MFVVAVDKVGCVICCDGEAEAFEVDDDRPGRLIPEARPDLNDPSTPDQGTGVAAVLVCRLMSVCPLFAPSGRLGRFWSPLRYAR